MLNNTLNHKPNHTCGGSGVVVVVVVAVVVLVWWCSGGGVVISYRYSVSCFFTRGIDETIFWWVAQLQSALSLGIRSLAQNEF